MKRTIFLILAAASLAACVSGRPRQDSYTSPTTGDTTVIQSDREMCESSCNSDYSRCMDSQAAQMNLPGERSGMFGASGQCRSDLSSCLPGCKAR